MAYHFVVLIVLAYGVYVRECNLRHHPRAALLCFARAQFVLRDGNTIDFVDSRAQSFENVHTHTHTHTDGV